VSGRTLPHNRGPMAKCFETWTVLPHGPLEKLSENVWRVEGTMPDGNTKRVMTIARMKDGRLVIHNAIALEPAQQAEIEAFGTPASIVVPNGFHRQDAKIYKDRYPSANVYTPAKARKKVEKIVPVTGDYDAAPKDDTVRLSHLDGCNGSEGVLEVKSSDGVTVVFNDTICNLPKRSGLVGFFLAPTGQASVPRFSRWLLVKDKEAFIRQVNSWATPDLARVIVSHGKMLSDRPADTLRTVTAAL
jgi:hypothetical protein